MDARYTLICINSGEEFELCSPQVTLGRDIKSDIVLRHGYPSRHHALIIINDGDISIKDLNSTNGTIVNNRKIQQATILTEGDVIQFDSISYHLVSADKKHVTVMMQNLKPLNAVEEPSSVVIIGGFSANDSTAIREPYILPATWSLQDQAKIADVENTEKYSSAAVDSMIKNNLTSEHQPDAALIVTTGKHETRIIGLSLKSPNQLWSIGRADNLLIQLTDISISSNHACVFYTHNTWGISDENSLNGTKVNGKGITEHSLSNNDTITLGQVEMIFRLINKP